MIIGMLSDFHPSDFASKNIMTALAYAKNKNLLALPLGKTQIDGDAVYVLRQTYVGKSVDEAAIEGHEKYLDLQLILSGREKFGYVDKRRDGIEIASVYDPSKDKALYKGTVDGYLVLHPGQFALVYPSDLHQPGIDVNGGRIEKAVFKIRID